MAVAIVQHADSVNETTGYADLPAPATAGNLILVRLSTRPSTTTLAMDPGSGYTLLGQVDITGERAGSAAIFAKNAAGGEQRIKRDLGFSAGSHVCAYEISGANVLSCELRSATHQTSATPFSLSAHTSATGLAFDLFIVTHNEGGVDRVWTGGSGNADWTEHHDGGPSGTGHNDGPWIWEGNATPTAAAITPTVSLTPPSGKTLSEWGGLSVQVSAPAAVVADFGVSPNPTTTGTTVTFTDASTGTPNQWAWDFGDAGTSTSQNPTHVYSAPGLYTITLTATRTSDSSSDVETKVWYVTVADAPEPGIW